jgi:hypothetical protein
VCRCAHAGLKRVAFVRALVSHDSDRTGLASRSADCGTAIRCMSPEVNIVKIGMYYVSTICRSMLKLYQNPMFGKKGAVAVYQRKSQ